MSVAHLQKLSFSIGLLDKVSGPIDRIQQRIGGLATQAKGGFMHAAAGAAGLAANVWSVGSALAPGIDMLRAVGEVKSLGVAQDSLDSLTKTAWQFSSAYGVAASDFVRSSYDIQSAVAGLKGDELARLTQASGVLAKATKSDSGVITSYVGTMFGIFQTEANKMGKGRWVEMLAGQTATAVQVFKTTGPKMADAFKGVGAAGQAAGISMSEQLAVLGTLQATMDGGEAGTKYRAFLNGVGSAQKTMGLQFTDAQGKMLPIIDILGKIKGKFGAIDTVAKSDLLKKAFGSDEAAGLIKLLANDIDGLGGNINKLGKVKGMEQARLMAEAMTTPFDKLKGATGALAGKFSTLLTTSLAPLMNKFASGATTLVGWMDKFPHLTALVGKCALGLMALLAAVSLFSLAIGISRMLMVGWAVVTGVVSGVMKVLRMEIYLGNIVLGAFRGVMWLSTLATRAWGAATGVIRGLMLGWAGAVWILNTALLASPITWIVVGVVALIAAVGALIYCWSDLTKWFSNTEWGAATIGWFQSLGGWLAQAGDWFTGLGATWDAFLQKLSNLSPLDALKSALAFLANPMGGIVDVGVKAVGGLFGGSGSAVATTGVLPTTPSLTGQPVGTMPSMAGVTAIPALSKLPVQNAANSIAAPVVIPGLKAEARQIQGGAGQAVARQMNNNTGKSGTQIGTVNIHTSKPMTPDEIAHLSSMHA
jgi:TP901 family phage tail tape measure protein